MKDKFGMAKLFFTKRRLLKALVIKNFRNRYSNTAFGFLWSVITPLLISLVISFVFKYIMPVAVNNFTAFVISGMLPWFCLSASLQESAVSLVENSSITKQFMVPLEFVPAACVIINFFNLLMGLSVATVFFMGIPAKLLILIILLPIPLILHFMFTLGLSFFVAALYVRYRDTGYILNIFLIFWLWATPVFYFLDTFPSGIRKILSLNIMIPFLNLYRSIFYKHTFFDYGDLFSSAGIALLFLICGYIFFAKQERLLTKII